MNNVEDMTDEELLEELSNLEDEIVVLNSIQLAIKIDINSLYGILANKYSRWCNYDLSLAVTSCGRILILYVGAYVNKFFNSMGYDNVWFYSDTDSNYFTFKQVVNDYFPDGRPDDYMEVVNFIDRLFDKRVLPLVEEAIENVASIFNASDIHEKHKFLKMSREKIFNPMFVKAKKMYAAKVYNNEGEIYDPPEISVTGLSMVRRETPNYIKKRMNDVLGFILNDDEEGLASHNKETRKEFPNKDMKDICSIKPANNLQNYILPGGNTPKGALSHFRGISKYNHLIREKKLEDRYDFIKEGDKCYLLYLRMPNPIRNDCICWPMGGELPKEFGLCKFYDFKSQFLKSYMKKVRDFTDILNWRYSDKKSMKSMIKNKRKK